MLSPSLSATTGIEAKSLGSSSVFSPVIIWIAAAVVFALVLVLVIRAARWRDTARWFALALAGQVCALQLLWVGPNIRLQLFYEWRTLLGTYRSLFLVVLTLQASLMLWGACRLWPALKSLAARMISVPQSIVLLALAAYAAITITPEVAQAFVHGGFANQVARHVTKVTLALLIYVTGAFNLLLVVATLPGDAWDRVIAWWRRANRRGIPWFCALWVVVVSSLLAWFGLDRMPHVPDELAYLFHAKYLAAGRLSLPLPPDKDAFPCPFCSMDDEKWYAAPPAGWPAVLALGVRLGASWLVNPLLGGIAILLAHALVRRLYTRETADGTVLLLAASPWLLFMSASLMGHPLVLVLSLLALLGVHQARESGSIGGAVAAGLSIGGLLHVRPLDAVIVAAVAGLWWLAKGWSNLRLGALASTLVCGLAMAGLFLTYNHALTGNAFQVPLNKLVDQQVYPGANRLGFGRDVGNLGWTGLDALPGHGPIDVVMNTNQNLYLVNFELFGWACGSLLFVFLLFVWRPVRTDTLMWGVTFAVPAIMSLYWFSGGPDFGARYWYIMIIPLAVLTVRGAEVFARKLCEAGLAGETTQRVWAFVGLATALGLVCVLPWRSVDKYRNYRGIVPDVRRLEREYKFGRSLVLVQGKAWPDFASAFALNPATFDRHVKAPIYALDKNSVVRERLMEFYADRPVWVIAGPTQTGEGFKVVEGPLPPRKALYVK